MAHGTAWWGGACLYATTLTIL